MNFYMPVCLWNEIGAIARHAECLPRLGTRALLVTGRNSAKASGAQNDVLEVLEHFSISWSIYSDIQENPTLKNIEQAACFGRDSGADFVIGIGGGSPLDAAKAAALLMANPDLPGIELYNRSRKLAGLPVAAVPTTCGTGSEVTPYSILTLPEEETKRSIASPLFPSYAFADPSYLVSAPLSLLRHTAADALSHCAESLINSRASEYSRMLALQGLRFFSQARHALCSGVLSLKELSDLMTASTLAGMAITHTGTSLPHALGYYLTYHCGLPHGAATGAFLHAYIAACPDSNAVEQLLNAAGLSSLEEAGLLLTQLAGKPSLPQGEVNKCIQTVLSNPSKLSQCPYPVDESILETLVLQSLEI